MSTSAVAQAAGGDHTCAVTAGGAKFWGLDEYGQLGVGTAFWRSIAMDVVGFENLFIRFYIPVVKR